jgi:hypothetical protein
MLTVLGPYAATGVETCGVVRSDRSTARELTYKSVCLVTPRWRQDGRIFVSPAQDHSYRCGEHNEYESGNPQELLRNEIGVHQWNI